MFSRKTGVALLTAMLLLTGCSGKQSAPAASVPPVPAAPVTYTAEALELRNYEKAIQGSAEAFYPVAENLSCPVSGATVQEYNAVRGDRVRQGDVLAIFFVPEDPIRTTELTLQLRRERQAYETGKLERKLAIEDADAAADRLSGPEQTIARLKADKLRVQYDQYLYETGKQLDALQEALEALEQTSGEIVLTAPFDGVLIRADKYDAGDAVKQGQTIITLQATDRFFLKVSSNASRLRQNMVLKFTSGAVSFLGQVVSSDGILPEEAKNGYALIQPMGDISYDQLSKHITFQGTEQTVENVIVVDRQDVFSSAAGDFVYLLEDGVPVQQLVKLGPGTSQAVWILDGLGPGDPLITN